MDERILLLESNFFLGRSIKYGIETKLGFQVLWYKSYEQFISTNHDFNKIDLAIIDYDISRNDENKVLDYCHSENVPIVLLADTITHDIQEKIWTLKIVDYILKGNNYSLETVFDITKRFFNNPEIGVLVVDNSLESRDHLRSLLSLHRYKIFETDNSYNAIEIINDNFNTISVVLIDYDLKDKNGLELTAEIRKQYPVDRLAIIGISAQGNHTLKISFIKNGANDFLSKPFISELLYCRITQNIKIIEYFREIKQLAVIDQLTTLNNRHFLKEIGGYFFENAKRHKLSIVAAMIDIDDFKLVNDTYGHDAGDTVLKEISMELKHFMRKSDIVIRFGGEEFLILANNLDTKIAMDFFNNLRVLIEHREIELSDKKINVTVSIGISYRQSDTLEELIINSDKKLYEAKATGKNRVCI